MKATIRVDAGVCGFKTTVDAVCEDAQHVTLTIETDCEKIGALEKMLEEHGAVDAFQEINPVGESVILQKAREAVKGCCAACAATMGVYKAMQVAAGLALPKDVSITMSKE